ncbi:MAG: 30S ribosomal protein S16 [Clostridia bacterium]|nr:30S ribosomal protein S16 [Clostridia bacterium]
MAVKIRLTRMGDKKTPFYRVVVADSRKARDGKYIDLLGTFNPLTKPEEIKIDADKAASWLTKGAEPTETAKVVLQKAKVAFPQKKVKAKKAEKKAEVKEEVKAEEKKPAAKKPAAKKTATKTTAKKTTKKEA